MACRGVRRVRAGGVVPTLPRLVLSIITNARYSDVTRQLGRLLRASALQAVHREGTLLAGAFQIALLRKHPNRNEQSVSTSEPERGRGLNGSDHGRQALAA